MAGAENDAPNLIQIYDQNSDNADYVIFHLE